MAFTVCSSVQYASGEAELKLLIQAITLYASCIHNCIQRKCYLPLKLACTMAGKRKVDR